MGQHAVRRRRFRGANCVMLRIFSPLLLSVMKRGARSESPRNDSPCARAASARCRFSRGRRQSGLNPTFRAASGAPCTNALLDVRMFPLGPAAMTQHTHPPQSDPSASADSAGPVVYTITEFCSAHKISRSKLYQLWRAGAGPRSIKIGSRNLITAQSASEWRRQLEGGRPELAV